MVVLYTPLRVPMTKELTITSCQAANTFDMTAKIGCYLTEKLGRKWDVAFRYISVDESNVEGWNRCYQMAAAGEIDISWVCAATYANLMQQPNRSVDLLATPLFSAPIYQNQPVYFSYLVVHAESAYQTFADLRGTRFAYNETVSLSGYHTICAYLESLGFKEGYFDTAIASGGHVKSTHIVAAGSADCAAIDSSVWHWYQSEEPEICEQLRPIMLLPSYAAPPLIISRNVPHDLAQEIQKLLLDLNQTNEGEQFLRSGGIARFAQVDDAQYESSLHAVNMGKNIPLVRSVAHTMNPIGESYG